MGDGHIPKSRSVLLVQASMADTKDKHKAVADWLTSYERVLARHQSSSICLMEFALGTPKLVER